MPLIKTTCCAVKKKLIYAAITLMWVPLANAQGGLEKVDTFIEKILEVLNGISIGVVTIAIIWTGFKVLYRREDFSSCFGILAGGLLIASAAQIAKFLLE